MPDGASLWLRLIPTTGGSRNISIANIRSSIQLGSLSPLIILWTGNGDVGWFRNETGAGVYVVGYNVQITGSVVYVTTSGELWCVDTELLNLFKPQEAIPFLEDVLTKAMDSYLEFMSGLGVKPPFRWVAGIDGVRGRKIVFPTQRVSAHFSFGRECAGDRIFEEGVLLEGENPSVALAPFFRKIFDQCATQRPAYLG